MRAGKVSSNIQQAILLITSLRASWYEPDCGKLVWGPVATGHEKPAGADYVSCHDTYDAIDLVVNDKNGYTSAECTSMFLTRIKEGGVANATEVMICDETNFDDVTPHIHIYDTNCSSSCRTH